jgi:hypothetical protein
MQNATATAIKPQNVSTNGDVHTTEEPGTVLDSHGESVTSMKDCIAMTDEG